MVSLKYPPPSLEQTKLLIKWIRKGALPETASARIGIPLRVFQSWLYHAGTGKDGYVQFAEAVDAALVEFQCELLDLISTSAFEKKNVSAATWLYMQRFGRKEQAIIDAQIKAEQMADIFSQQKKKEVTELELAQAEARMDVSH
jgi:hypothetical protein